MIESYSFGKMVVDGQTYTSDLIIFHDKIDDNWWRISGHHLVTEDMKRILHVSPEIIVIGTGFYGLLRVDNKVREQLNSMNINLIAEKTKKAVESYNRYFLDKKTVGAFHLTC
ncbi:MAG: hypothetical protein JXB26_03220 [Candidatus Aminicenantes bacterium]|nr:hypothetical protein [Candidatus Aminicenantes bacterium]